MSREVTNLTWRKNTHTPVYGVKEFVCLSVTNFDLNYRKAGKIEWAEICFGFIYPKEANLRNVWKFGCQGYFSQPVFTLFDKKSQFLTKLLPRLAPITRLYVICHTNLSSIQLTVVEISPNVNKTGVDQFQCLCRGTLLMTNRIKITCW